jgi:ABC-type Fe3+-siderophore transport system permease subunit
MNSNATLVADRQNETRVPELIAAVVVGPAIAAICVVMRIYTRAFLTKKYFIEDYSIVAALVRRAFSSTLSVSCLPYGF